MHKLACVVAVAAFSCGWPCDAGVRPLPGPQRQPGSAHDTPEPANPLVIAAAVTRTPLQVPAGALRSKTELVLRDIRFDEHPGMQFRVVLERRDDRTKRARAGTLSFYATAKTATRAFDVTDELRAIAPSPAELEQIDLVFEATTGRGGPHAKATVGPDVKVTVGAIEVRVK